MVRPYAMTRGRTRSAAEDRLDLIALVVAETATAGRSRRRPDALARSTSTSSTCAGHAAVGRRARGRLDLPVGVVRVLIGDLLDAELVHVTRPVPPAELPDESILREVINGLRAL